MATVQELAYSCIPFQSALFLSYLEFSPSALRFYQDAPTIENLERMAREKSASLQVPRSQIASILRRQNESFACDSITKDNIDELEKEGCAAIVTGQQVGVFGGPLYTIYKALTAVHIAETLNKRGIRAVPVFWMETEDHDLQEVTHLTFLDLHSSIQSLDYRETLFKGSKLPVGPVGSLKFPESIRDAVSDFLLLMPDSPWLSEIRHQLDAAYRPGSTFALSFGRLLSQILRGTGLIFFDPHDSEAKHLVSAVFQKSLHESDSFREALLQRNQELQSAGFHSQVSVLDSSTVLFFLEDEVRWALERRGSGFALKNTNRLFTLNELLKCAEQTPEKFSPNVLLRPLIQDSVFPTIAYVAGSAELAYFAQIEVLYRLFNRPMPIIWPRDSFTLIEPQIKAEMDRMAVDIQDCFLGKQHLLEKAVRDSSIAETMSSVEELHRNLDEGLAEIRRDMPAVDPTLAQALDTAKRKILYNAGRLKSSVIGLEANQNARLSNAVDLVLNNCFPKGVLQERELGILHFWARYGSSVLDHIRASLRIGRFSHHVLHLGPHKKVQG